MLNGIGWRTCSKQSHHRISRDIIPDGRLKPNSAIAFANVGFRDSTLTCAITALGAKPSLQWPILSYVVARFSVRAGVIRRTQGWLGDVSVVRGRSWLRAPATTFIITHFSTKSEAARAGLVALLTAKAFLKLNQVSF